MAEVKVPVTFGVSPKSLANSRAAVDPNLYPPKDAKKTTGKDGKVYTRWTETGSVDRVWYEMTAGKEGKAKLGVFVVSVRFRPGEPNQNKSGWFRLMVHPDIAAGKPVSAAVTKSYEGMTERALGSLDSLLAVAGRQPAEGAGLTAEMLTRLFPDKEAGTKSVLVGTKVTVKICQQPNEGGSREFQEVAEVFLPAKVVAAPDAQ